MMTNDMPRIHAIARNPETSPPMLDQLAGDAHWWVRSAVAGNSATPPATLDRLAGDRHWMVRKQAIYQIESASVLLTTSQRYEYDCLCFTPEIETKPLVVSRDVNAL
jgi:hypothetical protein